MNSVEENQFAWEYVEAMIGIELNIFEEISLGLYKELEGGMYLFIKDYFELDMIDLNKTMIEHGPGKGKYYGMNLLCDERFKKYCRGNIDFWREERGIEIFCCKEF